MTMKRVAREIAADFRDAGDTFKEFFVDVFSAIRRWCRRRWYRFKVLTKHSRPHVTRRMSLTVRADNRAHWPVTIRQLVGGPSWSLAFMTYNKSGPELHPETIKLAEAIARLDMQLSTYVIDSLSIADRETYADLVDLGHRHLHLKDPEEHELRRMNRWWRNMPD